MAAGLGFKTFTTGEVLTAADTNGYLMQGVLVFASAAARDAAITSPQEGQCCYLKDTDAVLTYSGAAWVGFDDSNAIQNSIVDAKGDLVAASGADTPARLAVGSNGETLVADSSATTGLRWQAPVQQNPVLNSAFQVWQRGTSIAYVGGNQYTADRWGLGSGTLGRTVSRQVTNDTTNLPFIQYCARVQRDSGNTATNSYRVYQSFETVNSIPFVGKTITFSFYARAGANYSSTSSILNATVKSGTGTDQNVDATYTGAATVVSSNVTLTTTWQRFTATGTVSTSATEIAFVFESTPTGTAGAADYFEVTGVQLEVGSVATPFKTYAATIQGELAACQRYYFRNNATSAYAHLGPVGWFTNGTTTTSVMLIPPVTMRTAPTSVEYGGTVATISPSAASTNISALALNQATATNVGLTATVTAVVNTLYSLGANASTAAYIGVSAEL